MEKEKNQKDAFQQHRCSQRNDCQVSKKLINLDSLKWLQLGSCPPARPPNTRSPQATQELAWPGPAARDLLRADPATNQPRADSGAGSSSQPPGWAPWLIYLLERHQLLAGGGQNIFDLTQSRDKVFPITSRPDVQFLWCAAMCGGNFEITGAFRPCRTLWSDHLIAYLQKLSLNWRKADRSSSSGGC